MKLKHVTSARQFNSIVLNKIFKLTDKIKKGKYGRSALKGKIMSALFYQPSTRTRLSFESAMIKLGGSTITTEAANEFSSAVKGESLEDTIRVVGSYADIIVIRHFLKGAADIATKYSKVPIINAGDGTGEHPTQALLDLYTIFSKLRSLDFTVCIVGDHAHYRPTHSLSYLLSLYPKIKIIYVSPKLLRIPPELRNHLTTKKINFLETEDFNDGISHANIIYQTRIPKEYLGRNYKKYLGKYIINKETLGAIKKTAFIMHPLPRAGEIAPEIDQDKRAIYFEEAENGLYIRMALLSYLLLPSG